MIQNVPNIVQKELTKSQYQEVYSTGSSKMLYSPVKPASFSTSLYYERTEFSSVKETPSPASSYLSSSLPLPINLLFSLDFDLFLLILCLDLLSFTSKMFLKSALGVSEGIYSGKIGSSLSY